MTFPETPLKLRWELDLGGWTDITSSVRDDDDVTISRGTEDLNSSPKPSSCIFKLIDNDRNFSPRNPLSSYYGEIGRNTPMRMGVERDDSYLLLNGFDSAIQAPDDPSFELSEFYVAVDMESDNISEYMILAQKWDDDTNNRSWTMRFFNGGIWLLVSTDGSSYYSFTSNTRPVAYPGGRLAIRCHFIGSTGTCWFETAPSLTGPWTTLGTGGTYSTTITPYDSTAPLVIGQRDAIGDESLGSWSAPWGRLYGAYLADAGGTHVASPDISGVSSGVAGFTDSVGVTWTLTGDAEVTDVDWEFYGEIPAWPRSEDYAGNAEISVTASGILRRLGQGKTPVVSPMRIAATRDADENGVLAYWPLEDGPDTDRVTAVKGTQGYIDGAAQFGDCNEFDCSDPLPYMSYSQFSGTIPFYTATQIVTVRMIMSIPSGGLTSGSTLLYENLSGNVDAVRVMYTSGGSLYFNVYAPDGSTILSRGPITFDVNDSKFQIGLTVLQQSAGTVYYSLSIYKVGASAGTYVDGTFSGTIYRIIRVQVNRGKYASQQLGFGHVIVRKDNPSIWNLLDAVNAHNVETTLHRFQRVCYENSIPYRISTQGYTDTTRMGFQRSDTPVNVAISAADSNRGIITDDDHPRLGLKYRSLQTMCSQTVALTLNYNVDAIAEIEPVDDDADIVNDATVKRDGGGSYNIALESGSLSVQEFPNGIGRYDDEKTLSLSSDNLTRQHAQWMLHHGTYNAPRYPSLRIYGEKLSTAQLTALSKVRIGDLIKITNIPGVYDDTYLIVLGIRQKIAQYEREYELKTIPGEPFNIARYGISQFGPSVSTLTSAIDGSQTTFSVSSDILWTTSGAAYPLEIRVGSEIMALTAVSGTTSPQTFTVSRGTYGLATAHDSGDSVNFARPSYYGM